MKTTDAKSYLEIERKFLVQGDFKQGATQVKTIRQGYLSTDPERTVRIRLVDAQAVLTIKGKSSDGGKSRFEWEKVLSREEGEKLFVLCLPGAIEKKRHLVPYGEHLFEVDVFEGANAGLVLAEVELSSATETVELPAWIGEEVSGDKRYYNAYLTEHPYQTWSAGK